MNTRFAVLFLMIMIASGLPAQEDEPQYPRFTADAGTLFVVGSTNEIVYASGQTDTKLSELVWPIPVSLGAWSSFRMQWSSRFETMVRLQTAFPLATGTMTDDDWNITDSDGNLLSRVHSDSEALLMANWKLRLEFAVPFPSDGVRWKLLGGFDYQHLAWEAWNPKQTATLASTGQGYSVSLTGLGIAFHQEWILPYVGGGIGYRWNGTDWEWGLRLSPYPVDIQTDAHVLRGLTFNERLQGGFSFEPSLSLAWPITSSWAVTVNASYLGVFGLRGDEVVSYNGDQAGTGAPLFYGFTGGAGSALQEFSLGVGLKANL